MKEETKKLLTLRGTLSAIARVENYLESLIEKGDTSLEEKILSSGKDINACWKYITFKAKEEAHGEASCCIDDETVFGWARHYYEDNAAVEEELKPKVQPKPAPKEEDKAKDTAKKSKKTKKKDEEQTQLTLIESADAEDVKEQDIVNLSDGTKLTVDVSEPISDENEVMADNTPTESEEKYLELADSMVDELDQKIPGEEMKCVICGKKLSEAFPDKDTDTIRKWADLWMTKFGHVFCSKAHQDEFTGKEAS